jgi:hypothetical protein
VKKQDPFNNGLELYVAEDAPAILRLDLWKGVWRNPADPVSKDVGHLFKWLRLSNPSRALQFHIMVGFIYNVQLYS